MSHQFCITHLLAVVLVFLMPLAGEVSGQEQPQPPNASVRLKELLLQRLPPQGQPAVQMLTPGNLPPQDWVHIMDLRMRLWVDGEVAFLAAAGSLEESQKNVLLAVAKDFIDMEIRRFSQTPYTQEIIRATNRPCEDFPVVFQLEGAMGGRLRALLEIFVRHGPLSAEQKASILAAHNSQAEFEAQALRDYIIMLLDQEMFFSNQQRADVQQKMQTANCSLGAWIFISESSVKKFEGISVASLQKLDLKPLLSPAQSAVMDIVLGGGNQGTFQLQLPVTRDEWMKQLDAAAAQQRDLALQMAELRTKYYSEQLGFQEEALAPLRVAAKGAAVSMADAWKADMQRTLEQNEANFAQSGTTVFGISGVSSQALEGHELWTRALTPELQALRNQANQRRGFEQQRVLARMVVAMLNRELCLSPPQREALIPVVEKTLPKRKELFASTGSNAEIAWLAKPLLKLSPEQLREFLDPVQISRWEEMRSYFSQDQVGSRVRIISSRGRAIYVPFLED